jgi:hypothetical protein
MLLTKSQLLSLPQEDRVFAVIGHLSPEAQDSVMEELTARVESVYGEDYWLNELDPEDRPYVDEADVSLVSEQDRDDLEAVYAWEAFGGFHNP